MFPRDCGADACEPFFQFPNPVRGDLWDVEDLSHLRQRVEYVRQCLGFQAHHPGAGVHDAQRGRHPAVGDGADLAQVLGQDHVGLQVGQQRGVQGVEAGALVGGHVRTSVLVQPLPVSLRDREGVGARDVALGGSGFQ